MTLGELIAELKKVDPNLVVPYGFYAPHSWRGSYSELAFEPCRDVRVGDMLGDAESALGATYQGWKGGDYTMHEYTDCYMAVEGEIGEELGPTLLRLMLEHAK